MIPVAVHPEPAAFDAQVRQKGLAHLRKKGFPLGQLLPPKAEIEPYRRACLTDLHQAYGGVCAYLCILFERVVAGLNYPLAFATATPLRPSSVLPNPPTPAHLVGPIPVSIDGSDFVSAVASACLELRGGFVWTPQTVARSSQ